MGDKVRWGILGCAAIAEKAFIPAVRASRNGVLQGIAARDPERARTWKDRFGFSASYPSYRELVEDPSIDAVYNPLPNHLHAEWSIRALKAGKHVLCEKPLAMNAAEARAMIHAAEESRTLLMEGFMYKFHPQIEKALALVRSGDIGGVRSVHSSFTFRFERDPGNYRWRPEMGGGSLYDVGCYTLSASRLVMGAEPLSVTARARVEPATGVDMTAAVLLEFPGGRFALCESSFEAHFQSRLLVVGDEGTLELSRAFSAKDFDVEMAVTRKGRTELVLVPKADMFLRMVDHFNDAVAGRTSLLYPPEDGYANMRVLDACFESIRTGRAVALV